MHLQRRLALELRRPRSFIWLLIWGFFFICFVFFLEQRSWRPSPQSSRTEARRTSRRQKSWRKGWRPWARMTPPPRLPPHLPNQPVAPQKAPLPSRHPRRRKNSSHRRSWKRARSRRRRWRPKGLGHSWPWWNTTVKRFCLQTWGPSHTHSSTPLSHWYSLFWLMLN